MIFHCYLLYYSLYRFQLEINVILFRNKRRKKNKISDHRKLQHWTRANRVVLMIHVEITKYLLTQIVLPFYDFIESSARVFKPRVFRRIARILYPRLHLCRDAITLLCVLVSATCRRGGLKVSRIMATTGICSVMNSYPFV